MRRSAFKQFALIGVLMLFALVGTKADRGVTTAGGSSSFVPYEELLYDVKLSRSILPSTTIGELRLTATHSHPNLGPTNSRNVNKLDITADAVSKGIIAKLVGWRFHERIESAIDPVAFTLLANRKLDEQGKRKRISETSLDQRLHELKWTEKDPTDIARAPRTVTIKFEQPIQDIASAIYYLRTKPLEPGKNLQMLLTDSGRIHNLVVKVVEKTRMSTVLGDIPVVRIDPQVFGSELLILGKGSFSIWLTEDPRHIPVRCRVTNGTGTLEINLKRFSTR